MSKNLALQIKEKKDQQIKNFLRLVLPTLIMMLVALFWLGKYINDNYSQEISNYLHPSPTPTSTATRTFTPTATASPTLTPPFTPTVTFTPTPTPPPLIINVNWGGQAVYEIPSANSENVSNGYLPLNKELELVQYCSPNKGEYWGLVRHKNRYGDYGWIFIDQSFKSLVVKNERRPLLDLLLLRKDLYRKECPGKYTPVP